MKYHAFNQPHAYPLGMASITYSKSLAGIGAIDFNIRISCTNPGILIKGFHRMNRKYIELDSKYF